MLVPGQLQALQQFWQLRAERGLPRRTDFGPLDLRPWLGNIAMVAIERQSGEGHASLRFRVALSGSRMDDYRGYGITNRYIDELCQGCASTVPHFIRCLESRGPVLFGFDNSRNSAIYPRMVKLLLPLADGSGAVERIMVGAYPEPQAGGQRSEGRKLAA